MEFNPQTTFKTYSISEFGGVNPSVSDSSTYTFYQQNHVRSIEGCYLSRHSSPSNLYLDKALAAMEEQSNKRMHQEWEQSHHAIAIVRYRRSHCF
jgi:hypothetical protein